MASETEPRMVRIGFSQIRQHELLVVAGKAVPAEAGRWWVKEVIENSSACRPPVHVISKQHNPFVPREPCRIVLYLTFHPCKQIIAPVNIANRVDDLRSCVEEQPRPCRRLFYPSLAGPQPLYKPMNHYRPLRNTNAVRFSALCNATGHRQQLR